MKRKATAVWQGTGKEGNGHLSTQSGVLEKTQYSYLSRFEQGVGTNPEELIAAAHAGCFAMKLSFVLTGAGFAPEELHVDGVVTLADGKIQESKLILKAKVAGIDAEKFAECVKDAELNCPISKSLDTNIVVVFSLN
ncbi:OsmC family peroxiredoxin [Mariniradius sediminis]|uniref:OsmC family peroxiredoxin n=1 Tax=Mariniradius sediminis TaxID=2909237 RepID=A0ABS9C1H6_9BACT|nr:OsmC family peroxiredoxin [Mariniradius sediminis]MCF1752948.1 OsmC family peroxiredoxin [Mariniradius sediminis]